MLFKAVERERVWVLKTVVDCGHIILFRAISSSLILSLKSQNLLCEDMSDWDGYNWLYTKKIMLRLLSNL